MKWFHTFSCFSLGPWDVPRENRVAVGELENGLLRCHCGIWAVLQSIRNCGHARIHAMCTTKRTWFKEKKRCKACKLQMHLMGTDRQSSYLSFLLCCFLWAHIHKFTMCHLHRRLRLMWLLFLQRGGGGAGRSNKSPMRVCTTWKRC